MEVVAWVMTDHDIWIRHRNLQRGDVKGRHIVLSAPFILIVDDIFPDIVVGIGIFDLSFTSAIVYDKH